MAIVRARRYEAKDKEAWDSLVSKSKNATFLFHRGFMEYHSERFSDHSVVLVKDDTMVGLFPAHANGTRLNSHLGLTYGGLISNRTDTATLLEYFEVFLEYIKKAGFKELYLKCLPSFLQDSTNIFQKGGLLKRRDLNFVVDLRADLSIHKSKLKKLKALDAEDYQLIRTNDFKAFWNELLIPVLKETYDSEPVHTLAEIELLGASFPENIIQYNVIYKGALVAGMTLFVDRGVVKSQYGVNNEKGKESRALDYLYWRLLEQYQYMGYRYFDMGTTTNANGAVNLGLTRYKEEFGATPMNLDHYLIAL